MPNVVSAVPPCIAVDVGDDTEEPAIPDAEEGITSHCCRDAGNDDFFCNKSIDDSATLLSSSGSTTTSGSGSSSSKEEDDESISSIQVGVEPPTIQNKQDEKKKYFQVVIVGAGAAGLQCAHTLIHEHGLKASDIVILEARNRVGGRICSIPEVENGGVTRDLGAAWIHGTRLNSMTNPALELLRQSAKNRIKAASQATTLSSSSSSSGDNKLNENKDDYDNDDDYLLTITGIQNDPVLREMLKPVQAGNPWMRPKTILHDSGGIGLYVQQSNEQTKTTTMMDPQDGIIPEALQEHFQILQAVSKKVTAMYTHGMGMDTIHCSIGKFLQEEMNHTATLRKQETESDNTCNNKMQRRHQQKAALTGFYQHLLTCWYGRSLFDLQLGYFDTDDTDTADSNQRSDDSIHGDASYIEYGDFAGPHCTVHNGMYQVLEPLLQEHELEKNCIRLGQVVTSIHPSTDHSTSSTTAGDSGGGAVVVETAQGHCVYGKTCVVTLPLGCLRQEQSNNNDHCDDDADKKKNYIFSKTPLSEEKQIAIQHMNMGAYKKVFLTFDRYFWDTKPAFLGLVLMDDDDSNNNNGEEVPSKKKQKNPLGNYLLINNLYHDAKPCLEAILPGDQGTWATGKSDEDIQSAVLDFMQQAMMPASSSSDNNNNNQIKDSCKSCHVTRWEEDPYSRGAYSSWSLGALPRHAAELTRPEWNERLYFAGEATCDGFEGSVHAALLSGQHAASSVSKHLSLTTSAATATAMQHPETNPKLH